MNNYFIRIEPYNKPMIAKALAKLRSMGGEWRTGHDDPWDVKEGEIRALWLDDDKKILYTGLGSSEEHVEERIRVRHAIALTLGSDTEEEE